MKKNSGHKITGLILAGGLAERMGECKALLPIGGTSALEIITGRLRDSGVIKFIVVTGGHEETVRSEALRLDCGTVHNPAFKSGMYSSVLAGVKALEGDSEAFFLLPADIPLVKASTYKTLIDAFYESYESPNVVYPTFGGTRGHPPLIGREIIPNILNWRGPLGLQGVLEQYARSVEVPTGDRSILLDMDTPEDYEKLKRYAVTEKVPDPEECGELLGIAGTPNKVTRHMKVVAECASRVADALIEKGSKLDRELLRAACLLHDIAKGEKEHEARGAKWLNDRGYSKVAKLVASHKDLPERKKIGEAEILYLSDKITDGETVSTLKNRISRMEERFAPGSEALYAARRRIKQASEIQKKIEKITGSPLESLLE
ncbi:MAG: NTP transferase domain-containing protein [Synergistaceae bacterium]|jgi:putative nucleotidyltransferase with HDIG domain|nr:NTP transferase domain-containing protein [Synergistaceae bacterium]